MYCYNCGTLIKEGSKFCHNCGIKLDFDDGHKEHGEIEKFGLNSMGGLVEEYTLKIKSSIWELFLEEKEISPENFFKEARFYNMSEDDVNCIYDEELKNVRYMNNFIENIILKLGKQHFIGNEQKTEVERYGAQLGIDESLSDRFLELVWEKNNMENKNKLWDIFIDKYEKRGIEKLSSRYIKQPFVAREYDAFKMVVADMDKVILATYEKCNKNDLYARLSDAQIDDICNIGMQMGIPCVWSKKMIMGFDKKSGRKEKRDRKVYARLDNAFSWNFKIFDNTLVLGSKYFLWDIIDAELSEPIVEFEKKYENLSKSSYDSYRKVIDFYNEFKLEYEVVLNKWTDMLEITLSDKAMQIKEDAIQLVGIEIKDVGKKIDAIANKQEEQKQIRKEAKENRGRWEGGGFGVSGALKGAATASAMNVASGVLYSGAGLVGSAISSMTSGYGVSQAMKEIGRIFYFLYTEMHEKVHAFFMKEIQKEYPEVYFNPYKKDTLEEEQIRNNIRNGKTLRDKEQLAYQLLQLNPANWRNGLCITLEFMKNRKYYKTNMENTDKALDKLEKRFSWLKNYHEEMEEIASQLSSETKNRLDNDRPITPQLYNRLQGIYVYLEDFYDVSGKEEDLEKLRLFDKLFDKIKDIQAYQELLRNAKRLSVGEIVKYGNQYCEEGEWERVKNLYTEAMQKDISFEEMIFTFYESEGRTKERIVLSLKKICDKKNSQKEWYERAIAIAANLKNQEGKTLLSYAAEMHSEKLMEELIKNGAEVDCLYNNILGYAKQAKKEITKGKYIRCVMCGKEILETAKFCNYCGEKQEKKNEV